MTIEKTVKWYIAYYETNQIFTKEDLYRYIKDAKAKNIGWTR